TFLEHSGNQPVEDLLALGATSCNTVIDIAKNNDVVILCVTGSEQVEEITLGNQALVDGLGESKVVVDCSTIEPHVTQRVAKEIHRTGAQFVDAPLTRTPKEAELGKVNVMVGGDVSIVEQIRPILETFAENIYYAGPTGTGTTLKLLHNFISLGNCALLAEAVVSAKTSGVDIDTFIEVLTTGGGDSTALKRLIPYILHGDVGNFRFSIANSAKDTTYYKSFADHLGVSSITADAVQSVFDKYRSAGYGDQPVPQLIDLLKK
ncbi:MAG: NAD(P)-dependent oxidoreductase, partial [Arenicellales bacterium]|nr:NAD(P)-dependent oxidoreductase [Arenicellales bacterium]